MADALVLETIIVAVDRASGDLVHVALNHPVFERVERDNRQDAPLLEFGERLR